MILPEFSHVVPLSEIGLKAVHHKLLANDAERTALAKRFGLTALDSLTAEVALSSDDVGIIATGSLTAEVKQTCVALAFRSLQRSPNPLRSGFWPSRFMNRMLKLSWLSMTATICSTTAA